MSAQALRRYIKAREATRAAEKAEEAAFRAAFPVDKLIEWKHGPYFQSGRVVSLGYGTRLLAENSNTGKSVWVEGYKIVEAHAPRDEATE